MTHGGPAKDRYEADTSDVVEEAERVGRSRLARRPSSRASASGAVA
jgi:hypothetical protein